MTKFWCNGKEGFCPHDDDVRNCVCCKYQDYTGGIECDVNDLNQLVFETDELCALRDQVHNLTLYLKEAISPYLQVLG